MGGAVVKFNFGRVDRPVKTAQPDRASNTTKTSSYPKQAIPTPKPDSKCPPFDAAVISTQEASKTREDLEWHSSATAVAEALPRVAANPKNTPLETPEVTCKDAPKPRSEVPPETTQENEKEGETELTERQKNSVVTAPKSSVEAGGRDEVEAGRGDLIAVGGTLPNYPGFYATSLKSKFWQYWIYDDKKGWVLVADEITPFRVKNKKKPARTVNHWEEYFDTHSRANYYVNIATGYSTWEAPACFRTTSKPRKEDNEGDDLEAMIDSWEGVVQHRSGLDALSSKLLKLFDDRTERMVNVLESRLEEKHKDIAQVKSEILRVRDEVHSARVTHHDLNTISRRLSDVESQQTSRDGPTQPTFETIADVEDLSSTSASNGVAQNPYKLRSSELPKLQVPPCVPSHTRRSQLRGRYNRSSVSSRS